MIGRVKMPIPGEAHWLCKIALRDVAWAIITISVGTAIMGAAMLLS